MDLTYLFVLFKFFLTTLSVAQVMLRRVKDDLLNKELERIWMKINHWQNRSLSDVWQMIVTF
jgi:hypothetical protein